MSIILDFILAAAIFISFIIGCRKGFVKSVWKLAALAVTIVLVITLKEPAISFLSETKLASNINARISESIDLPQGGGVNIAESLNLPSFMQEDVNESIENAQGAVSSVRDTAVSSLTAFIIQIIVCAALFIIIRLILAAIFLIVNGITKAPVIHGMNKFLGGLFWSVNTVFIVFLLLALASILTPADSGLFEAINNTYVVKYLYNYNILLQLFMKL